MTDQQRLLRALAGDWLNNRLPILAQLSPINPDQSSTPNGGDTMSHASATTTHGPARQASPGTRAAAPRDAAADQLRLLLLLAGDWLNNDRTHAAEIGALAGAMAGAAGPPVNVDVPYVSVTGATASCTMGNWQGEPTEYAYAWHKDGVAIAGATSATYAVQPDDAGHNLACVVTATNAQGATAAPMSNAVAIPGTAVQDQPAMRQDERRHGAASPTA